MDTSTEAHLWAIYDNNLFVVTWLTLVSEWGRMIHLGIRRKDGGDVNFEQKQRIKTDLVGASARAIEVYPAEVDVVNQAPVAHLWVLPEKFSLPFGLRSIVGPA